MPRLADRRAALEGRRAVGHLLRGERQVVRAGLDADPHALGAGPAQQRQRVGVGQVHDVHPRPGVAGRRDERTDRRLLGHTRTGGEEPRVARARRFRCGRDHVGVLRVGDQQSVDDGQFGQRRPQPGVVQRRELGHAGVEQEALEADDARLEQRPQLVDVARHGPAPEGDVGRDLAVRRRSFHVQRLDGGRRRDRVEGHVDDRGDAAGDRGARRRREALPVRAPRLVDVDVAVDQAGQEHLVVGQRDRAGRGVVERGDSGDPAVRRCAPRRTRSPSGRTTRRARTTRLMPGPARKPRAPAPGRRAEAAGRRRPRSGRRPGRRCARWMHRPAGPPVATAPAPQVEQEGSAGPGDAEVRAHLPGLAAGVGALQLAPRERVMDRHQLRHVRKGRLLHLLGDAVQDVARAQDRATGLRELSDEPFRSRPRERPRGRVLRRNTPRRP